MLGTLLTARGGVAIAISDNGDAIAPQDVQRIFEPFVTMSPLGKLPVNTQIGGCCNVVHPDDGANRQLRLRLQVQVQFTFPK